MKEKDRSSLLDQFAYQIGGWNASENQPGRLVFDVNCDDEKVVAHLLNTYKNDVEKPLKKEITKLKEMLFDLQNK